MKAGEKVDSVSGPLTIESVETERSVADVFNIEVMGHHVYRVAEDGILVHNPSGDEGLLCNAAKLVGDAVGIAPVRGGRYTDVRSGNIGGQMHHMPASVASPYTHHTGPSIWMTKADHKRTSSWGSSAESAAYRLKQADLIAKGKLRDAVKLDIDNIRSKFGNKYDANIKQMLDEFKGDF